MSGFSNNFTPCYRAIIPNIKENENMINDKLLNKLNNT